MGLAETLKPMNCLFVTMQKCNNFGVEVYFRIKGIKVQQEISETAKGNLSSGATNTVLSPI